MLMDLKQQWTNFQDWLSKLIVDVSALHPFTDYNLKFKKVKLNNYLKVWYQ